MPDRSLTTRRRLLKRAGLGAAAAMAAGLGWQFRPTEAAAFPADRPVPAGPGPSVLIVYASMMGSTAEQAQWIAEEAVRRGFRPQLSQAETAPGPEAFDAVILGSAIRASQWLEPALAWASRHQHALVARPHSLFQCSMTCAGYLRAQGGQPLNAAQRERLQRDLAALHASAPALRSTPVRFFPGRLEFSRLSPGLRLGYPLVAGSLLSGDHRQPEAARQWARDQLAFWR